MGQKVLFMTSLTAAKHTDIEGVGKLRYEKDGKIYRWAKNRNATAFSAKQPVCYDIGNVGTDALFKSVNSPVTNDLMLAAGIVMTALGKSGGTTGCYGWVQVEGYCQDARVTTPKSATAAVGQELICINGETLLSSVGITAIAAPLYSSHFIGLEALATAAATAVGTTDVMIRCL